jgi:ankyrin repeat protein
MIEKHDASAQKQIIEAILAAAQPERRALRTNRFLYAAAAYSGPQSEKFAQILLDHGADPCFEFPGGESALIQAASNGTLATFKLLTKHCPVWSPSAKIATGALQAALGGYFLYGEIGKESTGTARFLLEQNTPIPDQPGKDVYLCESLEAGDEHIADLMIDAGADLNGATNGQTPLDCALSSRSDLRHEIAQRLRKRGAKSAAELGIKRPELPVPF